MIHARDATGRQVSLLNDATESRSCNSSSAALKGQRPLPQRPLSYQHNSHTHPSHSRPSPASRSNSSSPNRDMPELLRSDSYDSQTSNDPLSPMTPSVLYPISQDYAMDLDISQPAPKRPTSFANSRATSFAAEDEFSIAAPVSDRPGKRYPCRYRDSHGCEKTFTTSGHASRHSKIHTAEKAVQCTYPGCQKKFTRADNMKQHLETHYKDKSRASSGQRAHKAALAEARRNSVSGRSRSVARDAPATVTSGSPWEKEGLQQYPLPTPPVVHQHSNAHSGNPWDMRGLNLPLLNRPVPHRAPSSGLDALAMAVAATEENEATSPHVRHGD